MTDIVERAGTAIAFPSQTMYVTNTPGVRTEADSVSAR
jgi:hypothetical protein